MGPRAFKKPFSKLRLYPAALDFKTQSGTIKALKIISIVYLRKVDIVILASLISDGDDLANPGRTYETSTFSSKIVSRIREALFDRKLNPGDFLGSEKDIAKEFGVSRMTARDALRTLEAMGIVEIRVGARGGVRIATGNLDRIADAMAIQLNLVGVSSQEILQVQKSIERTAAEMAAINANEKDLDRLKSLLDEADGLLLDRSAFTRSSREFHLAIADASHNRVLAMQLRACRFVIWSDNNGASSPNIPERVIGIHREIYEKIKAGDSEGAGKIMYQHLDHIDQRRRALDTGTNGSVSGIC